MSRRNQTVARGENLRVNQDANEDVDPTIHQLAEEANPATNLIVRLLEQQNRLLADMNHGGRNVVGRGNAGIGDVVITLERFKKLGPLVFKGKTDPIAVEAWLKQIEKVFTAIVCSDEQKVVFASFILEDEADHWWDATSRILKTTMLGNDHITWEMFKNAFNVKYFPDRVRFKMERDFLSLKQGSKSIAEYEQQFTSLSRFATKLIPDDESRGRRFLDGLHPDIQSKVEVLKLTRYADIVDRALIAERSLEECKKAQDVFKRNNQQGGSRNGGAFRQGSQFNKHNTGGGKGNEKTVGDTPFKKNFPHCQRCGRTHAGECYMINEACFGCGKMDHQIRDCPKRRYDSKDASTYKTQQKKLKTQGRVFAITEQDARASNDVVSGTSSLFSREATILFDSGATHSFVSCAFSAYANISAEPLDLCVTIATPMGDSMLVNQVYKSCLICFGGMDFLVDLLPLKMHDIDVILGMDWPEEVRSSSGNTDLAQISVAEGGSHLFRPWCRL
ncbi:hypothetical protein LWI28_005107 [Acer negundo]|uniref:CCHC-type domain-containing protein n=1 Tax=Acer negundo TaxID=4023 RepID=A0AAD5IC72_ACENE|nr:hypothetical protein LWI28_005107 [Acer negundo]